MRSTYAVTVSPSPDDTFAYLADVGNEIHWRSSIVGSRYIGADSPRVGLAGETDVEMGPRSLTMRWKIVAFDAEDRFVAWELDGDPWNGGGSYRVERTPAGATRVTGTLAVRLRGVARLLEPIVAVQFRRGLRADLNRLAGRLPALL